MRRLTITENFGLVTVETSAGVKTTGATVQSALHKHDVLGQWQLSSYDAVEDIIARMRPINTSQIHEGVSGT